MNINSFTTRPVKPEDARGWCELANRVWRIAYAHIFPEEVFLEKESKLKEKIARFHE